MKTSQPPPPPTEVRARRGGGADAAGRGPSDLCAAAAASVDPSDEVTFGGRHRRSEYDYVWCPCRLFCLLCRWPMRRELCRHRCGAAAPPLAPPPDTRSEPDRPRPTPILRSSCMFACCKSSDADLPASKPTPAPAPAPAAAASKPTEAPTRAVTVQDVKMVKRIAIIYYSMCVHARMSNSRLRECRKQLTKNGHWFE